MKIPTPSAIRKLISGKKVLIDTNIIIYLTDWVQPYAPLSKAIFKMIEGGEASAVLSIISVVEVMGGPMKKGQYKISQSVKNYLLNFPNIFCQEITVDVLEHIGKSNVVEWSKLRAIDSFIIASGLANDVDLFLSNDLHFQKALPDGLVLFFG